MFMFESDTADQVWLEAASALKLQAARQLQGSRCGNTAELLHVLLHVRDPRQRWVLSRTPGMSVAFAIVEVIGIVNGRKDAGYLNFFNASLPRYSGESVEYYGAYGHRLRSHFGFDQLRRAANALECNPDGRQVLLQIWDPATDFPSEAGTPRAEDIPCNICSMLKLRQGKLEWSQTMRSNDVFRGLPYNFIQFTTLQEVIAGWLGAELGTYSHFSDSLHVYEKDMNATFSSARIAIPENRDSLSLPMKDAERIWSEMNRRVDLLVTDQVSGRQFAGLAQIEDAPQSFTNLMAVVVADAARRRGKISAMHKAIEICANPVLQHLWRNWEARKSKKKAPQKARVRTADILMQA